jgi:phage shock protein E
MMDMHWNLFLIGGLVVGAMLALKRMGLVSAAAARTCLKQGALVVDVRSAREFKAGHLPNAVNMPLGELQTSLSRRLSDKNQVFLLHCLSGTRSGIARRALEAMGCASVFNLGSYGRAKSILNQQNERMKK